MAEKNYESIVTRPVIVQMFLLFNDETCVVRVNIEWYGVLTTGKTGMSWNCPQVWPLFFFNSRLKCKTIVHTISGFFFLLTRNKITVIKGFETYRYRWHLGVYQCVHFWNQKLISSDSRRWLYGNCRVWKKSSKRCWRDFQKHREPWTKFFFANFFDSTTHYHLRIFISFL